MGHNLGLEHAGSQLPGDDGNDEAHSEYGDPTSILGNGWWEDTRPVGINAPHLDQLGALPFVEDAGHFLSAGASKYTVRYVAPLDMRPEAAEPFPQALRLQHEDTGDYYYLSYRRASTKTAYAGHLLVHRIAGTFTGPVKLLGALNTGDVYVDEGGRLGVSLIALNDSVAEVEVSYGGCSYAHPQVAFYHRHPCVAGVLTSGVDGQGAPALLQPVKSADDYTVRYALNMSMVVANPSTPLCLAPRYDIRVVNISSPGLRVSVDSPSLTLPAKNACNVTLNVVAPGSGFHSAVVAIGPHSTQRYTLHFAAASTATCLRMPPHVELCSEDDSSEDRTDAPSASTSGILLYPTHRYASVTANVTVLDAQGCVSSPYDISVAAVGCPDDAVTVSVNRSSGTFAPGTSFGLRVTAVARQDAGAYAGTSCAIRLTVASTNSVPSRSRDSAMPFVIPTSTSITIPLNIVESCTENLSPNAIALTPVGSSGGGGGGGEEEEGVLEARESMVLALRVSDPRMHDCSFSVSVEATPNDGLSVYALDTSVSLTNGVGATRVIVSGTSALTDGTAEVTVKLGHANATVKIPTRRARCTRGAPAVSYECPKATLSAPIQYQPLSATAACTLTVVNTDSWQCGSSTFKLGAGEWAGSIEADEDLSVVFETPSISLSPGHTFHTAVTITYAGNESVERSATFTTNVFDSDDQVTKHTVAVALPITVGFCRTAPPSIIHQGDSYASVLPFQQATFEFVVRNENSLCCPPAEFTISLDESDLSDVFTATFSATTLTIPSQSQEVVTLSLIASRADATASKTYNFTVAAVSSLPSSHKKARLDSSEVLSDVTEECFIELSSTCAVSLPTVSLSLNSSESSIGSTKAFSLSVEVSNNNVGIGCPPLPVAASLILPLGFSMPPLSSYADTFVVINSSTALLSLPTNGTALFTTKIQVRENTVPKEYVLAVEATVPGFELGGPVRAEEEFTVLCPTPEAPHNVSFTQVAPVFSKNRVVLTWRACENALFCCCPCSWMVFRDGVFIGASSERSFTDSFNLDEGVDYNYSVVTVDKSGTHSPSDTCRNAVLVTGVSADITTYVIIFACLGVFILTVTTSVVVVVVYLNWEKIDSKLKIWKINALQKFFVLRHH